MTHKPRPSRHLTAAPDHPGAQRIALLQEQVATLAAALTELQDELAAVQLPPEPDPITPKALTVTQAAKALGVSRTTLYRVDPPFPRLDIGGVMRIPVWWVEQVASHEQAS